MKTKLLLTAIASLIIASTAQAQLGLTTEQCKQKFGKPSSEDKDGLTFDLSSTGRLSGSHLILILDGGKVVSASYFELGAGDSRGGVRYAKIAGDVTGIAKQYSPEITSFFQWRDNNSSGAFGGISWKKVVMSGIPGEDIYYVGSRGGKVAMYVQFPDESELTPAKIDLSTFDDETLKEYEKGDQ